MADEAFVCLEGGVYGVVGHVQVERFALGDGFVYLLFGLQRQCVGQEGGGAVILLQVRYGPCALSFDPTVSVLTMVASRVADGRAGDVDVKAQSGRVFAFAVLASEVRLAYVDGLVSGCFQYGRIDLCIGLQALPVPFIGAELVAVVAFGVYPVGGAVACRVLSCHDGRARGRADALGVEGGEARALCGQPFHVGRAVPVVQRLALGFSVAVGDEGDGSIHQSHIVYEEDYDVGALLGSQRSGGREGSQ